jgi:3-oxoacyl-[acyl-carrier-protein] synthase III
LTAPAKIAIARIDIIIGSTHPPTFFSPTILARIGPKSCNPPKSV